MTGVESSWLSGLQLNPEQRAAVVYTGGPMRILAGAGTGKTQTLTARFAYLVRELGVAPHQILALTFSRKAAEEMRNRVVKQLDGNYRDLSIMTFHAFCLRLVREWRREDGVTEIGILGEDERRWLAGLVIDTIPDTSRLHYFGAAARGKYVGDLLTLSDRAKEHLLDPEKVAEYAARKEDGTGRLQDLALAFAAYQTRLFDDHQRDYGDLAMEVVARLRSEPLVRERTRSLFQHLLVDEFQDTNLAQFSLLELLMPDGRHLCVVGDPNQSIYAFRGGRPEYITNFPEKIEGAVTFSLTENYRSGPAILNAANQLIAFNDERERFDLRSYDPASRATITASEVATVDHEAEVIARRILKLVRDPLLARRYGDIAILVRSLKTSQEAIIRALTANGIPYRLGGDRVAGYEVVQDLLAALRLTIGPSTWKDAVRLAVGQGASAAAFRGIEGHLGPLERDLALSGERVDLRDLSSDQRTALQRVCTLARNARESSSAEVPELVYRAMELSGQLRDGVPAETGRFLSGVLRQASTLAETGASANDVLEQFIFSHDADDNEAPDDPHGVQLLTVHAAKGLEWPIVFVAGLAEGLFPVPMRLDRDFDLDQLSEWVSTESFVDQPEAIRAASYMKEERRLAYVAITRGKEEVHLIIPRASGVKRLAPSIFVAEAGLGDPTRVIPGLAESGPPATMTDLVRNLRTSRQRALAASIDDPNTERHLSSLMLAQWAASGLVDGATPLRDRLIPEPYGDSEPLRFSFSRLSTYESCPRRYLYGSVLGLELDEDFSSGTFGTAVHDALKALNHGWLESGTPPDDPEIERVVDLVWPEAGFDFAKQREQLRLRARKMLSRYYTWERSKSSPRKPVAIESAFREPYGMHTVTGRIDLALKDETGGVEIIDFKTGNLSNLDKAPESMQLYLYDHAWKQKNPEASPRVSFYALRQPDDKGFKTGPEWIPKQNIGHQHTEETAASARQKIDGLLAGMLENDFTPRPGEKTCGFCRFRWLCPEG